MNFKADLTGLKTFGWILLIEPTGNVGDQHHRYED